VEFYFRHTPILDGNKAVEYRQQAEEARSLVKVIPLKKSRAQLVEIAKQFEALAQIEEKAIGQAAAIYIPSLDA